MTSEATRTPGARTAIATPDGARFEFSPHNCFACGTLNTGGLGLVLHVEPGRSWTELALDTRFEGWEGVAHGGILCTVLDEVMAWALVGEDNWGVTARMAVEFRRPVPVGTPIRAEGWITRARRRVVDTAARIVEVETRRRAGDRDGIYVAADPARKRDLRERYGFRAIDSGDVAPGEGERPCGERRMTTATLARPSTSASSTSEVTARAVVFVAAHREAAEALGASLADLSNEPEAFADRVDSRSRGPGRSGVPRRPAACRARHR